MIIEKGLRIFMLAFLASTGTAFGQPGDPGGDPDAPVPITGIEYLLGAGALLGINKLRKSLKSKEH